MRCFIGVEFVIISGVMLGVVSLLSDATCAGIQQTPSPYGISSFREAQILDAVTMHAA